jgi:hypothetical protein
MRRALVVLVAVVVAAVVLAAQPAGAKTAPKRSTAEAAAAQLDDRISESMVAEAVAQLRGSGG